MAKSAVLFGFLLFSLSNLAFCKRSVPEEDADDDESLHVQIDEMGGDGSPNSPPEGVLETQKKYSGTSLHTVTPQGTLEEVQPSSLGSEVHVQVQAEGTASP
eukprot:gnl/MRDRNA2_/MRDRNA2_75587_c0_seq1.p1 gnl/MRDRNA2_/MRDRNA2_75587_c0~~gnl/MRDRNA2_/MRDRNA2_75587_c0_seq1.p1  ORF type:complete len:102 (-),score=26.43 gnl/MRDRNA2_/MRDRNA2_75587_c0_seq1:54-359(-)